MTDIASTDTATASTNLTTDDVSAILGAPTLPAVPDTTVTARTVENAPQATAENPETPEPASGTVENAPQTTAGYTPVFGATVRTAIYITCLLLGILGGVGTLVSALMDSPAWLTVTCAVCGYVAPLIASGFGVAYNPVRQGR
ncbi:hypothetical protein [Pseudoscardovia radai]|uniref:hypothetical protein n=1 Tax=Pseudoscardovia radai TaxID=987066 RepID=UPI0039956459